MHSWNFFLILAALMVYTGLQARRLLPRRPFTAWLLTGLLFGFMLSWNAARHGDWGPARSFGFGLLSLGGSFALGVWSTFILLALPADLARMLFKAFQWIRQRPSPASAEPVPRASKITALLVLLSVTMSGLGFLQVLAGPRVKEVSVPVRHLAPDLEGLRIVLLSDLHIGPTTRPGFVESLVRSVAALRPDVIAVTGDLAEGAGEETAARLKPLSELRAPLGVYFVMGNHEFYRGAAEGMNEASALGFIPLLNQNRVVPVGRSKLLIGGVTDGSRHHGRQALEEPDAMKAAHSGEAVQFKLFLAHRPEACFAAEPAGFDLQLSGHSHGGQYFPWSLVIPFFHPYSLGFHRHGRMWIYITPGAGYWGPPNRFLVPPEITLLCLTNQPPAP